MAKIESQNQTEFSAEEPFFEQPVAMPRVESVAKPVVPFFKRRKTIVFLIMFSTVLLLVVLFAVNLVIERNKRIGELLDFTIATPAPTPPSNLLLEVEQLRKELKAADPTQLEFQPPAVDPELRLDPKER